MVGPKPMPSEFGIHHRLESCGMSYLFFVFFVDQTTRRRHDTTSEFSLGSLNRF